ncbi:MAG: RHS repeat-associated core domain-containing protein, partial [Candidatus Obscuribacterales bacterium]|nr:RHS repeat-associated core domain-containing protein [Candidatus Obscuribacterales bacterium]
GAGPLKSIANSAIPNSTITFEYDALGHVTNRSIGSNNSDEWKFDKMGRPISEENVLGKFQFHYGETSQSASKNTKLSSIEYPNGLLTRFDYADAAESDYLKSIKTSLNTNEKVVSEFGYQQDKAGQLTKWNEAFDGKVAAQYSFSYDSAGQLTDAQDASTEKTVSRNYHFEYDQDSNRTLEKNDNGVTRLAYGSTNELLSVSNRASGPAQNSSAKAIAGSPAVHDSRFVYDANGNLLSDNKNSYKWDAENRLIQITYPGTGNYTTFTYNGAEKCAKITETSNNKISSIKQLIWSQNRICEIRDENGDLVTKLFAFGEEIVGQKYYFTRDHLGSTRLVSDSKGNIKSRLDYDPLGHTQQLHGEIVPDLQYAGYYSHKPSGLNLTVFRAYSSELGRWINRDPVGEFGLHRKPEWSLNNAKYEILASNLYAYANNNSIQFSDPFGLCPSTKGKMIPMDPKYDNSNSLKGSVQYTDIQGFDPNIYGSGPQAPDIGPSQLANIFDDNTDDVWPNPNQTPIEIASSDPSETGRTGPAQTSQPPPPPPQPTIPNQSAPQIIMG